MAEFCMYYHHEHFVWQFLHIMIWKTSIKSIKFHYVFLYYWKTKPNNEIISRQEAVYYWYFSAINKSRRNNETVLALSQLWKNNIPITPIIVLGHNELRKDSWASQMNQISTALWWGMCLNTGSSEPIMLIMTNRWQNKPGLRFWG